MAFTGYKTNKFELKARVEQGPPPWAVAWSDDISETDVLRGVVAGGVSIYTANPAPFILWVENLIIRTIDSLQKSASTQFPRAVEEQVKQLAADVIREAITTQNSKKVAKKYDTVDFKAGAIRYSGRNVVGGQTISRTWGIKPYVAFRWRGSNSGLNWRDGMLLTGSGTEIYIIREGRRRHIPDEGTFSRMGLRWNAVVVVADDVLNTIPLGSPMPSLVGRPVRPARPGGRP